MPVSIAIHRHEVRIGPEIPPDAKMAKRAPAGGDATENVDEVFEPAMEVMPEGLPPEHDGVVMPRALPVDPVAPGAPETEGAFNDARADEGRATLAFGGESAEDNHASTPVRHTAAGGGVRANVEKFGAEPVDGDAIPASAWLIFPAGNEPVSLGSAPSGEIGIALGPAMTDAILEALGLGKGTVERIRNVCGREAVQDVPAGFDGLRQFDSRASCSSPRVQAVRVEPPPRVAERPRVENWLPDELLTLPEAVALFWPSGPLTLTSLRTAGHEGSLEITVVAGKHFVTPAAIRSMGRREVPKAKGETVSPDIDPSADLLRRLAEARSAVQQQRRRASR